MSITEESRTKGRTEGRQRVRFDFLGELEDVPSHVAVVTAAVARELLCHVDGHRGRPATLRVERGPDGVSLTLVDPECSPACVAAAPQVALADGHVELGTAEHGALRLRWSPERRGDGRHPHP